MTTLGSASPASPDTCSRPPTSTAAFRLLPPSTGSPPACRGTMAPSSPAATAAPVESPSSSPSTPAGSPSVTPGPTTPRPAARSNASTKRSSAGSPPSRQPSHQPSCKLRSTASAATTTPSAPTGPWAAAPPRRPTRLAPRRGLAASPSTTPTGGSATTPSTTTASSPCATTADCITSASAAATPANACSSSSKTYTCASPAPTASSSANSNSTPPATTNPSPKRERCPETPVHGVPRHRTKWSWGYVSSGHRSQLSRDIVHTSEQGVRDGDGGAGGHGGVGGGPVQERGGPGLRGVAPLGHHLGAALPGRGRRWAGCPVPPAAPQPEPNACRG